MSKFLPEKKKLLEEVYEKASSETSETSFSGILKYLEIQLRDEFQIVLSYKTFENYYKTIVENDQDYNIKTQILDDLSKYVDYDNFKEYCAEWKTFEHKVTEGASKVIVHVINKPLLTMPEFLTKQSNLGIIGVLLVCSAFAGNKILNDKKESEGIKQEQMIENIPIENMSKTSFTKMPSTGKFLQPENSSVVNVKEKECMYWDLDHYERTFCNENANGKNVIAYQPESGNLRKIMRPDTLTVENAFGKVWYVKSNHHVEFFNTYGQHPENDKTLKQATKYIISKYGKQKTPE